jgi:hypothetical protein
MPPGFGYGRRRRPESAEETRRRFEQGGAGGTDPRVGSFLQAPEHARVDRGVFQQQARQGFDQILSKIGEMVDLPFQPPEAGKESAFFDTPMFTRESRGQRAYRQAGGPDERVPVGPSARQAGGFLASLVPRNTGQLLEEVVGNYLIPAGGAATKVAPIGAIVPFGLRRLSREVGTPLTKQVPKMKDGVPVVDKETGEVVLETVDRSADAERDVLKILGRRKAAEELREQKVTPTQLLKRTKPVKEKGTKRSPYTVTTDAGRPQLSAKQIRDLKSLGIDPVAKEPVIGTRVKFVEDAEGKLQTVRGKPIKSKVLKSHPRLRAAVEEALDAPPVSPEGRAMLRTNELRKAAAATDRANPENLAARQAAEREARMGARTRVLDEEDFLVFEHREGERRDALESLYGVKADEFTRASRRPDTGEEMFGHPTGRDISPWTDAQGGGRFPEGGWGDVALPHGLTSDGMSSGYRRARQDGGRQPTSEELESWTDYSYAEQGRKMPISTRRVLQAWEPEELIQFTLRAIEDGDLTNMGRKWYNLFRRDIVDFVGEKNIPEFANVFAFLSPQNIVEANLRDAFAAMRLAREYSAHVQRVGREFDVSEFADLYEIVLRRKPSEAGEGAGITLLGKLGKGSQEASTTLRSGNLRPMKDAEGNLVEGTMVEKQKTPREAALKIGEFYKTGEFSGDLKVKSFSMTTALKDKLGGAATSTNDVRVGAMFGFKNMVEGDGYLAIQHLAAETAREVSKRLDLRVTTDEVQAIWWALGASVQGTENTIRRLGRKWPHPPGSIESALEFAGPEIEAFGKLNMPLDVAFVENAHRFMTDDRGGFPMNLQMFTTMTEEQLKDLPKRDAEILRNLATEKVKESAGEMYRLGKEVFAKTGLVK